MKYFVPKLVGLITGISFIFNSCIDNEYDLSRMAEGMVYDPNLAISIGTVNFNIDKFLSDLDSTQSVKKDDKGFLYIIYEKDVPSFRGEDKVVMPGQAPIVIPSAVFASPNFDSNGEASQTSSKDMPINFGADQQIDSMIVKYMTLQLTGNSTFPHNGKLIITFTGMVKNGIAFSDTFNIPANSSNLNIKTQNKASGYHINFSSSTMGSSKMPMDVKFVLNGTPGTPIGTGNLDVNLQLGNAGEMKYFALFGYIGQTDVINATDSLNIEFLNRNLAKNIEWADPKLTLLLNNSYGVPVRLTTSNMSVYSEQYNQTLPITFDASINPKDLLFPTKADESVEDSIIYTKQNSTLFTALEYAPKILNYKIVAHTNTNGYDPAVKNVMVDTSIIRTKLQFHLPMWFRSSGFEQVDTLAFNAFGDNKDNKNSLNAMLFRIISDNGMPIDMDLQITFVDKDFVPLETIFKTSDHSIVKSAVLGSDDKVSASTRSYRDIVFDASQLKAIEKTKNLLVKVSFKTGEYTPSNGRYVKFYDSYNLKLSFACQFQLKIKL
jgi:hypothetical protein